MEETIVTLWACENLGRKRIQDSGSEMNCIVSRVASDASGLRGWAGGRRLNGLRRGR